MFEKKIVKLTILFVVRTKGCGKKKIPSVKIGTLAINQGNNWNKIGIMGNIDEYIGVV